MSEEEMATTSTGYKNIFKKLTCFSVLGFVFLNIFFQWNGRRSVLEGEEVFKEKWIWKSLFASNIIEIIYLILTFRVEDSRMIFDNSEGITIFFLLHFVSNAAANYYNTAPLTHRGANYSPMLIPVLVQVCSLVCRGSKLRMDHFVTSCCVCFGSMLITLGVSRDFSIHRIDYLSFMSIILTLLKTFCLKDFREKNIKVHLRGKMVFALFGMTMVIVTFLEVVENGHYATFFLVSSISSLTSIVLLNILYNKLVPSRNAFEISGYVMMGILLHQIVESEAINVVPVMFGACILMFFYRSAFKPIEQVSETNTPFKGIISSNQMYTRIEFALFMGGVILTFLYILPLRVSSRDMNNLSYIGLDKVIRNIIHHNKLTNI